MYVPPFFKTDAASALEFAHARGFGTLVAVDGQCPTAVRVPFIVEHDASGATRIECHVARANPIHKIITAAPSVLLTIDGPDAYISPDWYIAEDQVPTWNYVSVHIAGEARLLPTEQIRGHVDRLSARFEADLLPKKPWLTDKMTEPKLRAMLSAIQVIEIAVTTVEASRKLSQNKNRTDRVAVSQMLRWRGGWRESEIAEFMDTTLRQDFQSEQPKENV
ncbi:MAG: FMN-binding negative transcriptional regulator [Hyphomicrobiaceae bacterium]|nr:FMN-binding negative transcriptional regulator [Hyphomicrobiaceae bacterium]